MQSKEAAQGAVASVHQEPEHGCMLPVELVTARMHVKRGFHSQNAPTRLPLSCRTCLNIWTCSAGQRPPSTNSMKSVDSSACGHWGWHLWTRRRAHAGPVRLSPAHTHLPSSSPYLLWLTGQGAGHMLILCGCWNLGHAGCRSVHASPLIRNPVLMKKNIYQSGTLPHTCYGFNIFIYISS